MLCVIEKHSVQCTIDLCAKNNGSIIQLPSGQPFRKRPYSLSALHKHLHCPAYRTNLTFRSHCYDWRRRSVNCSLHRHLQADAFQSVTIAGIEDCFSDLSTYMIVSVALGRVAVQMETVMTLTVGTVTVAVTGGRVGGDTVTGGRVGGVTVTVTVDLFQC